MFARLQVAVDDSLVMRRRQCAGHCRPDARHLIERQAAPVDQGVQRLARDQLHRQEVRVAVLFDRVNGDDVRVVQRGQRARFAPEPLDAIGVGGHVRGKDLEGDVAPERGIRRPVDRAHAAAADEALDRVAAEARAGLH